MDSQLDKINFELNGKLYQDVKRIDYNLLVWEKLQNNELHSCKVLKVEREIMQGDKRTEKLAGNKKNQNPSSFYLNVVNTPNYNDTGFISRVMHQGNFTEHDFASFNCAYAQGVNEDTYHCSTVSPAERNAGCESLDSKELKCLGNFEGTENHAPKQNILATNNHPTVKPMQSNRQGSSLGKAPKGI
ncbi:MAG: hypothetical protein ACKO96_11720, partial [Flammeovirgaceae bacterium]